MGGLRSAVVFFPPLAAPACEGDSTFAQAHGTLRRPHNSGRVRCGCLTLAANPAESTESPDRPYLGWRLQADPPARTKDRGRPKRLAAELEAPVIGAGPENTMKTGRDLPDGPVLAVRRSCISVADGLESHGVKRRDLLNPCSAKVSPERPLRSWLVCETVYRRCRRQ